MKNVQPYSFLFHFLESSLPQAAETARKMESLIFQDSASAIVKARTFAEQILTEVYKIEDEGADYNIKFYDMLMHLSNDGTLTQNVQRSFDTIRRSGNKAAHVAGYDDIVMAFQLHKEMFRIAVWFYESYTLDQQVIPKYRTPKPMEEIKFQSFENRMKELEEKIISKLGDSGKIDSEGEHIDENEATSVRPIERSSVQEESSPKESDDQESEKVEHEEMDLSRELSIEVEKNRTLLQEVSRLKDSAKEAIENASEFSDFKEYLHVDRKIQHDLEEVLKAQAGNTDPSLILLCGSVGDGKSHLLAYMNKEYPEIMRDYYIHNDATESFSPDKDAMETLTELLHPFSDRHINHANQKIILAVNLGVLHNFINQKHETESFERLKQFIIASNLFSQNIVTSYQVDQFSLFNFTDYHPYELTAEGPTSEFYEAILDRLCNEAEDNPFHKAFLSDLQNRTRTMLHENYNFLKNETVRKQLISLVIQVLVKKKLVISTRAFLNFIADILISDDLRPVNTLTHFEILKNSLPTMLFEKIDRSIILENLTEFDPIHIRTSLTDNLMVQLNTLNDWKVINDKYIKEPISRNWLSPFEHDTDFTSKLFTEYYDSFIRIVFLSNEKLSSELGDETYKKFMKELYYFNIGQMKEVKAFYEFFKEVIYKWKGELKKGYIQLSHPFDKYKLGQRFSVKPVIAGIEQRTESVLYTFKSKITVGYSKEGYSEQALLDIDYPLYELMNRVQKGYRPRKDDEDQAIKFMDFLDQALQFGDKRKEMLINFPRENKFYKIKRDDFGSLVFERE